jgi:hypothetical protein
MRAAVIIFNCDSRLSLKTKGLFGRFYKSVLSEVRPLRPRAQAKRLSSSETRLGSGRDPPAEQIHC